MSLLKEYGSVAMVGDSINDAPTSGIEHRRVAMGPPEA
jgi:hypothetical protein